MSDDRELSALYQSADKPQPPAELNDAIRSAAHNAVKPKRSHAPQWLGGIAASLIAALLLTQLLPNMERIELDASLSSDTDDTEDAPLPAAQSIAPERARTADTLAPKAPVALEEKVEPAFARELKPAPRKKAFAMDNANSELSVGAAAQEARTSPEAELRAITDLLDAGKTREAAQRLEAFQIRYPETKLPEALARRLDQQKAR